MKTFIEILGLLITGIGCVLLVVSFGENWDKILSMQKQFEAFAPGTALLIIGFGLFTHDTK